MRWAAVMLIIVTLGLVINKILLCNAQKKKTSLRHQKDVIKILATKYVVLFVFFF
jgi:hypothetical protein